MLTHEIHLSKSVGKYQNKKPEENGKKNQRTEEQV